MLLHVYSGEQFPLVDFIIVMSKCSVAGKLKAKGVISEKNNTHKMPWAKKKGSCFP